MVESTKEKLQKLSEWAKDEVQKSSEWVKQKIQQSSRLIGVDIGASAIKLLELDKKDDVFQVVAQAFVPLPAGAVTEKDIKNPAAVTQALKEAAAQAGVQGKAVAIAVPDSTVINKIIQFDASLNDRDMENQILLEADRHIPYPIEDVSLDFQILGKNAKNPEWVDVLLVASHKENVDARVAAVNASGLQVKVVDVESYAIERVSRLLTKDLPQNGAGQTIAVVDIGATMLTLTVLHDQNAVFTRSEVFGVQQLIQMIEQRYGLPYAEAERAIQQSKLPDDYVAEVLEPFREAVVLQIRRALQFFFSTSQHEEIQHLYLTGGVILLPDMATLVAERLGISTKIANPLNGMIVSQLGTPESIESASRLMLCCGLALRNFN